MNPGPRAIVFDLDGTLIDSAAGLNAALNEVFEEEGWPHLSLDAATAMTGDGTAKFVERAVVGAGRDPAAEDLQGLLGRLLDRYGRNPTRATRLYPGVAETLPRLRRAGYAMGVCTNKHHGLSVAILRAFGLEAYMDAVIGGDSVERRKPHPEPLLATLVGLGVPPSSAVMVGDSPNDVAVARAAGVAAIAVSYGYDPSRAAELGPDLTIDRFADLPDALECLMT